MKSKLLIKCLQVIGLGLLLIKTAAAVDIALDEITMQLIDVESADESINAVGLPSELQQLIENAELDKQDHSSSQHADSDQLENKTEQKDEIKDSTDDERHESSESPELSKPEEIEADSPDVPKIEEPEVEEVDEIKIEEPDIEESSIEEHTTEESTIEEPSIEEPKVEDSPTEEPESPSVSPY